MLGIKYIYYIFIFIPGVLDSYDSSGNVDHERDENIFPESLNREDNSNDIGLENRNSKPQNMQLSNFPFNFFKKQMVNGGSQNTNLLSIRRCCVNGQCLILLPDEQCGDAKFMVSVIYVEYTNYSKYNFKFFCVPISIIITVLLLFSIKYIIVIFCVVRCNRSQF